VLTFGVGQPLPGLEQKSNVASAWHARPREAYVAPLGCGVPVAAHAPPVAVGSLYWMSKEA
jgi:hypothetical protein